MPDATSSSSLQLAVVGGGISGLAAAFYLQRQFPAAELQLFEATDRLGGPLHTIRTGDAIREQGADSFLNKSPWATDLCRDLRLTDELVPTNAEHRRALVVRDGKLLPVPDGFVLMRAHRLAPVLRSPVLSLRGKLRLLAEPLCGVPAKVNQPHFDESVASFAARRLGREAYERLVQPLTAGIYVADATKLSLAATMPEFLEAERRYGSLWRSARTAAGSNEKAGGVEASAARYGAFLTLRGGISRLIEALAESLPAGSIHRSAPVRAIEQGANGRWIVQFEQEAPPREFDGVVVAAPAPRAAKLVTSFDPALAKQLAAIEYASSAVITLVYPRDQIANALEGFGFVVPTIEGRPVIAGSFSSVKFPHASPSDQAPIRVFVGGVLRPALVDHSDDELIALAHQQLQELAGVRVGPLETHVARWRGSMPQYHVDHLQRVDAIEAQTTCHRGLELAGNAYRGVGIPQCIESGRKAAERLAQTLIAGFAGAGPA